MLQRNQTAEDFQLTFSTCASDHGSMNIITNSRGPIPEARFTVMLAPYGA
jgi:hypothetical protein